MGTSKSYGDVRKSMIPNWAPLSSSVTRSCDGSQVTDEKLSKILDNYVRAVGGSSRSGRGSSKIAGRSGIRSAMQIGGFLGGFEPSGNLEQALAGTGLVDLSDKSVDDIINHLIEYCSGPATTIDDSAAKEATRKVLEEIASDAKTIEELQEKLQETLNKESVEEIMIRYFGYYIHEHLSNMFYEKLVKEKGKSECSGLFRQIRDYIVGRVKDINKTNPLNGIDWGSNEADRLIKNIQEDVLKIFEE